MQKIYCIFFALLLVFSFDSSAQQSPRAKNMVIFVMDGYRWQELYQGADSAILFENKNGHHDSAWTVEKYWDADQQQRRRKLMPFVWNTISQQGQLFGNRQYGNFVNVKNKYWFSYPGRSEIFTGYFDSAVNSNEYPDNPNTNVLEFIHQQPAYRGKIAIFSSWDAVIRIMNRKRSGMLINSYGEDIGGAQLTPMEKEANFFQHTFPDVFGKSERLDAGTYALAKAYLLAHHPRILYIDLGDNDEFAHANEYGHYLDAAHYADAMFKDIWNTLQQDPFYKGQTDLLIFPDHGRGLAAEWTSHGAKIEHSDETYFLAMGPGIEPKGEIKTGGQIYQQQYAQTIAALLGIHFTAKHPIAPPVTEIIRK